MPARVDFRQVGSDCLQKAKELLKSDENENLVYAALELRMSMEAVIYNQAGLYKSELPENVMEIWQPKKLLEVLLEIDPNCDVSSTIAFGVQKKVAEQQKI
jgi:hypothetical protein